MTRLAICSAFVWFMVCSSSDLTDVNTCSGDSCEDDIVATQLLQTKLLKISAAQQRQNDEDDALMRDHANRTDCTYCFCSITAAASCGVEAVTSAALCGSSTVTNAAQCGTESITNAAKCGSDPVQLCTLQTNSQVEDEDDQIEEDGEQGENNDGDEHNQIEADGEVGESKTNARKESRQLLSARGRRRRRKGGVLKKIKKAAKSVATVCRWEDVARTCLMPKSCAVPNTCDMPKTCDVTSSLSDCLSDIKSYVPSNVKAYVGMIASSGCDSATSCKSKVNSGLSEIQEFIKSVYTVGVRPIAKSLVDEMPISPSTVISTLTDCVSSQASAIAQEAQDAGSELSGFFSGHDFTFQKWDFNNFCTASGEGFWYMEPTDCGVFDAMVDLFAGGVSKSLANYNKVSDKLKTCALLTGMFGFPTPFMNMKIQGYCLPSFLLLPLEYIVGGIVYAQDAAANSMFALVSIISDKLCFLLQNSGINLQQLGALIQEKQKEKLGLMQTDTDDWNVHVGLQLDIEVMIPSGKYLSVSFGFKLLAGTISGAFAVPNLAMFMSLGAGIVGVPQTPPEKVLPQTGVTVSFGFTEGPSAYTNRGAVKALFDIIPKVNLDGIGIPAEVGLPISFQVLPSITRPTGLSVEVSASTSLLEMGKDIKAQVATASRQAHEKGEDSVHAAIHHAIHHLATDSRLDRAFESTSLDPKKIVDTMVATNTDHAQVVKEAMEREIATEKAKVEGSQSPTTPILGKGMSSLEEGPSKEDPGDASPLNVALQAGVSFEVCLTPDIQDVSPCAGAKFSDLTSVLQEAGESSFIGCIVNFISGGGSTSGGCR